ncbi:coiled-coil domain-containing protein 12 [Cimex lectularius]|uniref:Coiled-coil domain-containing protein 12 n=1 Tax=Cimex lectularius TaxID=79782 RepID=A0A8I6TGD5_CIMLE|nr:coiled-coil domain-containing protein 12 [Cimex lectularius]
MMIEEKVGTLEEEGLKRKERLKALKRKQDENDAQSKKAKNNNANAIPKPVFRSYLPKDEKLKETTLPPAKPGDVKSEIKDQLESAKTRVVIEELDLANLAPRKPDWDLKRDVAKKLDKLEKRTQKAIAELIRDRLKNEQTDLATQVAIGASAI